MKIIILAAGCGNRFKNSIPKDFNYITKSLLTFKGESAITRLINQINSLISSSIYIVIGHKYLEVLKHIEQSNIKQDNLNFVVNQNYLEDSNLKSLYMAIDILLKKNHNLNGGTLIIEADTFLKTQYLKDFTNHIIKSKYFTNNQKEICWTSKGLANKNQSGGFLDPELNQSNRNYGNIKDAYISNIRNNNYSLKMYGITWMNEIAVRSWYEETNNFLKTNSNLSKLYFHDIIFKNKNEYFMSYYNFGERVHSFNNYDEYIECLKLSF